MAQQYPLNLPAAGLGLTIQDLDEALLKNSGLNKTHNTKFQLISHFEPDIFKQYLALPS